MSNLHETVLGMLEGILHAKADTPTKLNQALRVLAKYRSTLLQNTIAKNYGVTVQGGIFQGMQFVDQAVEGCLAPKLLGCYEAELQPYIMAASQRDYQVVINIGAAEGYYAIGMARLMPQVQVYAYDLNPATQSVCRTLAEQNGVGDRIHLGNEFRGEDFETFSDRKTLIICDIEGGELALLNPEAYSALRKMDVIVELHDVFEGSISQQVIQRFEPSHEITRIGHQIHGLELPEMFSNLAHLDQLLALWEWRSGPTPWAVMIAN
jgi:hypothetical protein